MPPPHKQAPETDTAATVPAPARRGVVAVVTRRERFLVIRRSSTVVAPRAFCFPGGGIETGETEAEALVREFREELGAPIVPGSLAWRSRTPWGTELAWWTGTITSEAMLEANPLEVESVHWFTAAEMLAREELLESNRAFLKAWAQGEIKLID